MLATSAPTDIAWAAGLFEGEGCVRYWRTGARQWGTPQMSIGMTDLDVLQSFHRIVGVGTLNGPYRKNGGPNKNYKPQWVWTARNFENVQALIAAFWPWLQSRRRQRAVQVLQQARAAPLPSSRRVVCPQGHLLSGENLYINCRGQRVCRECNRGLQAKYRAKNRVRLNQYQRARRNRRREKTL